MVAACRNYKSVYSTHCSYIEYESYISACEAIEMILNNRFLDDTTAATARRVFPDEASFSGGGNNEKAQMEGAEYYIRFVWTFGKENPSKIQKIEKKLLVMFPREGRQDLWEWDSLSGASPTMMPDLWDSAHVPSLVSDAKQIADLLPAESDPAGTQAQASPRGERKLHAVGPRGER
ncbi:hypothetical protein GGX14DRAFT_392056 [Mycena pura]|uniref:Uncharacterized protein n=1 Tax=Mycena pura TaxID=153505 RepID=A0AAD6VNT4_9AGAR|nr:hypothetical protein GGX14DRAFT_392056 [Mycena pura]